ncbi:GNAT family N-acetyltransferase [Salipaludibacillus agaradhaerens]|jgi:ribosomal protein S18 acetylase RimI-like enzyme|uniref:GNAT family N-acetyltransferase n=1 Tax=Salipaludibacillus agaradhaerens TaxID=76935 RepID=UPI0021516D47|nr:GNAT family N-acetyltransferase [Salipaludibacillus agaradhaerens]MCR6107781.1 GNAT family N-acetyltransferase [Salipaludibacillus agaradhaerens]MCR6119810.1 GNAT family N-acetyltransferase [Salipaludibacillus agaradhaerens]UJW58864.1 GNAT family N-acetyltransferase [Bacillus sp. A116_S68]
MNNVEIEQVESIERYIDKLSELLIKVVADGASIGFLPPLSQMDAHHYWENLLNQDILFFVAKVNNQIAGSVQLHLCNKQNGTHRAEIAKLMTHPNYRRNGIGRTLMSKAEERAVQEQKSLIVLDTREGDPSNLLYSSLGYIQAGKIPNYAKSANGELHPTVFYYKSF